MPSPLITAGTSCSCWRSTAAATCSCRGIARKASGGADRIWSMRLSCCVRPQLRPMVLAYYRRKGWSALATVLEIDALAPPRLLDHQGWSTLFAGALLLLLSFTTNYGDDNLLQFRNLAAAHQIRVGLHFAALAALTGDVELATRLRHRAANEAARCREQATRRARIQARRRSLLRMSCLVAQCRFHLADTTLNRLQLSEALAVLIAELKLR